MRKIGFASAFVLAFSFAAFGQNSPCPIISITGSSDVIQPGANMTFTVRVSDIGVNKISYNWSVSDGSIVGGQGTEVITVDTSGLNDKAITATVQIQGLPSNCADSVSETGIVALGCGLPVALDEYERLNLKEEKERLQAVAAELRANEDSAVLFMIYYTAKDTKKTLRTRILRVYNNLIRDNKIPKERVSFIFAGIEELERTKIYLAPVKANFESSDWEKDLEELKISPTSK